MDKLPIFTIGDSHAVWSFTIEGKVWDRITYCLRIAEPYSWTMHRVGRDSVDFTSIGFPTDSIMLLSFGWIDVHYHIEKQIKKGRDEDEIINTLINNYIAVAVGNRSLGQKHIGLLSIIPTVRSQCDPSNPTTGSAADLCIYYTAKMNALLKQRCQENKLLYLNLYDTYRNEDGSMKEEFSDGNIHLKTLKYHDQCFDEMLASYACLK
jgi:hypothetical protein